MTTLTELSAVIAQYNDLVGDESQTLDVFHYWRSKYPYAIKSNDRDILVQGTKEDCYIYVLGAIRGIYAIINQIYPNGRP